MSRIFPARRNVPDRLVRVMALLTATYSIGICAKPRMLAGPSGYTEDDGSVSPAMATMTRSTGTRDVVLALLLATATPGRRVGALAVARAVADGGDAIWFSRSVPRGQRWKVSGAAAAWAATELTLGLLAARRSDRA